MSEISKNAAWGTKKKSKEEFKELLQNFDYIRLSFPDLSGMHLSKLLSTKYAEKIAESKLYIYSGVITFGPRLEIVNVPKVCDLNHRNGLLRVDPSTIHSLPWKKYKSTVTGKEIKMCGVICDMMWFDTTMMDAHPRYVAQRMVDKLKNDYDMSLYSAFEPEFRMFQRDTVVDFMPRHHPDYKTIPPPKPFTYGEDMYKSALLSKYEEFFLSLNEHMDAIGIRLQDFSVENGEGQLEVPMIPNFGIASADEYFTLKESIREICAPFGMFASFMAKPLVNASASGCHFNHSLWDTTGKVNKFYDPKSPNNLSDIAMHWIGGLMHHLPSILAFCCPTVNCYRRLHRHLAPHLANWDMNDRFVAIRVKGESSTATYVENRVPSSASCSYHVMAATIAAGMDGLKRKLKPPKQGVKDPAKADVLPSSLQEALELLRNDKPLVEILGEEFVDWFIQVKERGDLATLKDVDLKTETNESLALERYEYFQYS